MGITAVPLNFVTAAETGEQGAIAGKPSSGRLERLLRRAGTK